MIGRLGAAVAYGAACVVAFGCGEDVQHVQLVIAPRIGDCGHVPNANEVALTALTESGNTQLNRFGPGEPIITDHWPGDTRQVELEVSVGATRSVGKTAPFDFDTVGASIPITLIAPDQMCPMGDLLQARRRPQVIAVGDGALVVGGAHFDMDSGQLLPATEIEYFDPVQNAFTMQRTPLGASTGMRGGALVRLTDGRIVFVASASTQIAIYNEAQARFPEFKNGLLEPQGLAAVVPIDDHRIAVAGGCAALDATTDYRCALGQTVATVEIIDVDDPSEGDVLAPSLSVARANAVATLQYRDGAPVIVVSGGVDDTGTAVDTVDVIPLAGVGDQIPGSAGGAAVALDAGSTLTAFAPPGTPASQAASVAVVGAPSMRPIAAAPTRRDTVLVPLEDGSVLAIGGRDAGDLPAAPALYEPLLGWSELTDGPMPDLIDHAAARLADGTVLIVGGVDASGTDSAAAWRFRPSLVGPFTDVAALTFPNVDPEVQLTALDPSLVDRAGGNYTLTAEGAIENLAVMSGLRTDHAALTVDLDVAAGAVALVADATGPGDRIEVVLEPGADARVDRISGGVRSAIATCAGGHLPAAISGSITLTIDAGRLELRRAGASADITGCEVGDGGVGLWGLAAVGDGARITVHAIDVAR